MLYSSRTSFCALYVSFLSCYWSATSCPPQGNSFRVLQHGAESDVAAPLPRPRAHAGSGLASSAEVCCGIGVLTVVVEWGSKSWLSSNFANFVLFLYSFLTFISFPPPLKQCIKSAVVIKGQNTSWLSWDFANFAPFLYPFLTFISFPPSLKQCI
jgi:hypothetical protein